MRINPDQCFDQYSGFQEELKLRMDDLLIGLQQIIVETFAHYQGYFYF